MSEEIGEILSGWKDRLNAPVTGVFTTFVIMLNWRVWPHLIYGDQSANERIEAISALFPTPEGAVASIVLIPVAATFLYVYFIPKIRAVVFEWQSASEKRTKETEIRNRRELAELELYGNSLVQIVCRLKGRLIAIHAELDGSDHIVNRIRETPGAVQEGTVHLGRRLTAVSKIVESELEQLRGFFEEDPAGDFQWHLSNASKFLRSKLKGGRTG